MLIVFDEMIADMTSNEKLNSKKIKVPKDVRLNSTHDVRLNSTHLFIMKIPDKRELQ